MNCMVQSFLALLLSMFSFLCMISAFHLCLVDARIFDMNWQKWLSQFVSKQVIQTSRGLVMRWPFCA